jgi:hypothetical protein
VFPLSKVHHGTVNDEDAPTARERLNVISPYTHGLSVDHGGILKANGEDFVAAEERTVAKANCRAVAIYMKGTVRKNAITL